MPKATSSYQAMQTELDKILQTLQNAELDIDEATDAYERGLQLIEKLEKHLKTASNKVTKIKASFDRKKD
ncbi:exodeoxyribonuclease VII small subunit [Candidatus Saccharibacteria bacterium]|nr:exodeoxyribonuclease VII small subunit [Candidatus Saccharibacteria bacterium]